VTAVRRRPLWRAAALAALLAVGFAAPHLAGHDEARAWHGDVERAFAAAPTDGGSHRPALCLQCLAGTKLRVRLARAPVLAIALSGPALPLAPRAFARAPRAPRGEPAAPRAPPIG
jgi:hypothetical protein